VISAGVGFGVFMSSAYVLRIIPGVQ